MAVNNLAKNQLDLTGLILKNISSDYCLSVDMTLGKGYDAERILENFDEIKLIGLDIQEKAIEESSKRLSKFGKNRYRLIQDSHANIDSYISQADLFIYNLGYLPGYRKDIVTEADTTLKSLKKAVSLLNINGLILMVFYLGHSGGMDEYSKCKGYIKSLSQKEFITIECDFINQKNNPPKLIAIERIS